MAEIDTLPPIRSSCQFFRNKLELIQRLFPPPVVFVLLIMMPIRKKNKLTTGYELGRGPTHAQQTNLVLAWAFDYIRSVFKSPSISLLLENKWVIRRHKASKRLPQVNDRLPRILPRSGLSLRNRVCWCCGRWFRFLPRPVGGR